MKKAKKIGRFVYWAPRVLAILFMLFLALFSLDVFESASNLSEILLGLLIHNIPVFILLVLVIISWGHELVGAITFISAGLLYVILTLARALSGGHEWYLVLSWSMIIAVPAFLTGVLFFINWNLKRKCNLQ